MGLTADSTGLGAIDQGLTRIMPAQGERVIALAGNPNVGKSTVFNALTGLNQHTGNWPGKTVTNATGTHMYQDKTYHIVDLPGTYSLQASSVEEEIARDFICFGHSDAVVVVCDATCLERNLNLVLQTIELAPRTIVCVNLLDEAQKKQITVDLDGLSAYLGVPVVGTSARSKKGLEELMHVVSTACQQPINTQKRIIDYGPAINESISALTPLLEPLLGHMLDNRWVALRLLEDDDAITAIVKDQLGIDLGRSPELAQTLKTVKARLTQQKLADQALKDQIVSSLVHTAEEACQKNVHFANEACLERDRRLDRLLTSRLTGTSIMLAILAAVFWLTITGANYPSQLLSTALFWLQDQLTLLFHYLGAPEWLHGALVLGVYRVLAWVISVMLPPMAIFFPLFTLLEDFGYLPRVAFNLDHHFKKACACGKQALTMCIDFIIL